MLLLPSAPMPMPVAAGRADPLSAENNAITPSTPRRRGEFLIAAETGSGKTLAYLLPAIHALKVSEAADEEIQDYNRRRRKDEEEEQRRLGVVGGAAGGSSRPKRPSAAALDEPHPTMARPRVVVLVPSAELADQVGRVAKVLSHAVKFRSETISSRIAPRLIQRNVYSSRGLDVLVATPHLLAEMAESDANILSRVSHLVVDEADSLLDRSFAPHTTKVLERALPSLRQLVACSATIPKRLDDFLARRFPDMIRLATPNLHAVPRRVQLGMLDVSGHPYMNNKDIACADAIYSIGRDAARLRGPSHRRRPTEMRDSTTRMRMRTRTPLTTSSMSAASWCLSTSARRPTASPTFSAPRASMPWPSIATCPTPATAPTCSPPLPTPSP